MARVRIVKKPTAQSGLEVKMRPGLYGTNGNNQFNKSAHLEAGKISQKPNDVRQTLEPVDREDANLEAEKGETAVLNMGGMPAHFKIGGKRHSQGGTPLNLPDNSFIFSDTAKMKIKDPAILAQFGMALKKGGYTPAEISKKYDINKFRKILADPNSDDLQRKTAEMMIANYNEKLAKLSIAQESIKGFPQGIPVIAMPYIESMKMDPATFLPDQAEEQSEEADSPDAEMGTSRYGSQIISKWSTKKFGGLPKAQDGLLKPSTDYKIAKALLKATGLPDYPAPGYNVNPKAWEADPSVAPYYRKYQEALKLNDPYLLRQAAQTIKDTDVPGFWWQADSPQNKLSDFGNILSRKADEIDAAKKQDEADKLSPEKNDITLRNLAKQAWDKASEYKAKARARGNTDMEIKFDELLKTAHKLHPEYKGTYPHRQAQAHKFTRSDKFEPYTETPAIYYTRNEGESINKLIKNINDYATALDTPAKKEKYIQIQDKAASNTKTNIAPADTSGLAAFKQKHNLKKEGGSLIEYRGGGKVTADDGTFRSYEDGSIYNIKTGKWIQEADSNWKAPASSSDKSTGTKGTKTSVGEREAYPGYTEEELKDLLVDPSILRYEKVRDKQKKEKEGIYGKGVSLKEFKARNSEYVKKFKETHGGKDITEADVETFQNEYTEHVRGLAKKRALEAGYTEKEATEMADRFAESQGFKKDIKEGSGDPRGIDKKFGEWTSSRFEPTFKKKAAPVEDTKTEEKGPATADRGPIEKHPPFDYGQKTYAPWWLQDIVKTAGAAADIARIQRYLPWQATPEVRLPDATFYDPTRELAANAEQANIQTQGMAAFTGPQALSARSAQIQGQALKNAADIMGKYNNMNVQLANQLSQERTSIMNHAAQNKAALDTQLFDKYTIANQQFDNAKNMARQNLRQSYIDAITNRAKTQALNTLYPNFYTDPSIGGFVNKTGYASINPTPQGGTEMDEVQKIMERFPGTNAKDAYEIYRKGKGADNNPYGEADDYRKAQGYT